MQYNQFPVANRFFTECFCWFLPNSYDWQASVDPPWVLVDTFVYVNAYDESETKEADLGICKWCEWLLN